MKIAYPIILTECETNILVEVPDLGILTEANEEGKPKGTVADAIMMARDAIGLTCIEAEDEGRELIKPSDMLSIDISKGTFYGDGISVLTLVDVDLVAYRRKVDTKTVRRNVALPSWLNYEAEKAGVNVSRILQEALISVLKLERRV